MCIKKEPLQFTEGEPRPGIRWSLKSLWRAEPLIPVAAADFRKPPLGRLAAGSASVPFGRSSQAASGRCCGLALALAVQPVLRGQTAQWAGLVPGVRGRPLFSAVF